MIMINAFNAIHSNSPIKSWKSGKNLPRISKIKAFTNKYNWNGVKYSSGKDN